MRVRLAVAQSGGRRGGSRKLALPPSRQRSIHTAGNGETLPGTVGAR